MRVHAKTLVFAISIALGATSAAAWAATTQSVNGSQALSLAAVIAPYSPQLSAMEKNVIELLYNGKAAQAHYNGNKLRIKADSVQCRYSHVDITEHECTLQFGAKTLHLRGRKAHEIFAVATDAGVQTQGAAGSIYASFTDFACELDLNEIKHNTGGGALCKYTP